VRDRAAGYAEAMVGAGLAVRVTDHTRYVNESEHVEACRALLSGADRPTAVLVYSERDVSALMTAAAELGLVVPRDLSVVAFAPGAPWEGGQWVSVAPIPTAEMGRRAVEMLVKKIRTPDAVCDPEVVAYAAVSGGATVAPPSRGS
jgi:DNA-binding LacI/PurR family transcriptional regulator